DHQVAGSPSLCLASSRIQFSVHTTGQLPHWWKSALDSKSTAICRLSSDQPHPVEIARRPASWRAIAFGKGRCSVQGFRDDKCPGTTLGDIEGKLDVLRVEARTMVSLISAARNGVSPAIF